jgi:hypothetical protein
VDQTHELSENPAPTHFSLGSGNAVGEGRELLEWDFDAYVSRAGEAVAGNAVGVGGTYDLYRWGVHPCRPLVLANNEALIVRTPGGWGSPNTWRVGITVEWAEVKAGG